MKNIICLTGLITFITITAAMACSCMEPTDSSAELAHLNADFVVRAEIISKTNAWNGQAPSVRLRATETLKGIVPDDEFLVNYNNSTAACGHVYDIGQTYLIGLYDTSNHTNHLIKGSGYRIVSACEQLNLEHYFKAIEARD